MHKTLKMITFTIFLSHVCIRPTWAAENKSCESWKHAKPKIENLRRVVGCGPEFSTTECAENSGYGLKVAATGAVAGGVAAATIKKNIPTVCGLNIGEHKWWQPFVAPLAVAAPTCSAEFRMAANQVAENLRTSIDVKRLVVANDLTEKVAKENPQLNQMAKIVSGTFQKSDELLTTKLKALNEKLKPLGVEFVSWTSCKGNPETCDKLMALSRLYNPVNMKANLAGNAELLAKYFKDEASVIKFNNAVQTSQQLIKQVESGKVLEHTELAKLYSNAAKVIDGAVQPKLAETGNYITTILPDAAKTGVKVEADALLKNGAGFLAKHSAFLKKILPFGLSGLLAISTGANADEVIKETTTGALPLVVTESVSSGGCDELDSPYFPRHLDSGKCVVEGGMNDNFKNFLGLTEDQQMAQVCQFSNYLPQEIDKLSNSYFPSGMNLTCGTNSATASTPSGADTSFYGKFDFAESGELTSASIMPYQVGHGVNAYDLQFKDGSVVAGKVRTGKSYNAIKPGTSSELADAVGRNFAGHQVVALAAQACCSGGSGDSCSQFKQVSKSGTTTSSQGQSPGTDNSSGSDPGQKGVR